MSIEAAQAALLFGIIAVLVIFALVDALFSYWTPGEDDEHDS